MIALYFATFSLFCFIVAQRLFVSLLQIRRVTALRLFAFGLFTSAFVLTLVTTILELLISR